MRHRSGTGAGLAARLFLALACGLSAVGCRRSGPVAGPPLTVVRYEPAQRLGDVKMQTRQTYLGVVRGENETDLSFKVGGLLDLIGSEPGKSWGEGDPIEANQVLAQLKQVDFKAELDSSKARAELARSRFARAEQLLRDQAISPQEFDVITAGQDEARAALDRAQQAFLDSTLRAPFAGRVLARLATGGEIVMQGRPVLRIADLSVVSVDLGVPDRVVNQIRPGQRIPLVVTALEGRQFDGEVSEVGVAAKEGSRLFKVVLKVQNSKGELRSGMTATATFQETPREFQDAVLVRLSALVSWSQAGTTGTNRDALAVFVVDDSGRAQERRVETDDLIRSSIVVTQGVKPGEKVVVVGASRLHDGEPVAAREFVTDRGD